VISRHKQLNLHAPELGVYGDCARTAYACLLGLHPLEVPHFLIDNPPADEFCKRQRDWLASRGLTEIALPMGAETFDEVLRTMGCLNPDVHYLVTGMGRAGCQHVVICYGNRLEWDPSRTDSGIIGPCSDGFFWLGFLAPLSLQNSAQPA